jgi:hypothetical protein
MSAFTQLDFRRTLRTLRRYADRMRLATVHLVAVCCVSVLGCTMRERRPDGPYREAEEFADALSDAVVECTGEHSPQGRGSVAIAAEFTAEGQAPVIHDAGSMPGSEPLLACVKQRASHKLRSPKAAPAPFVRIKAPVPLVTSEVKYAFIQELPR